MDPNPSYFLHDYNSFSTIFPRVSPFWSSSSLDLSSGNHNMKISSYDCFWLVDSGWRVMTVNIAVIRKGKPEIS